MRNATASRTDAILARMSTGRPLHEVTRHKRPWRYCIARSIGPEPRACSVCDTTKHRRYRVEIGWLDGSVEERVLCLACEGSLLYGSRL